MYTHPAVTVSNSDCVVVLTVQSYADLLKTTVMSKSSVPHRECFTILGPRPNVDIAQGCQAGGSSSLSSVNIPRRQALIDSEIF